MTARRVAAGCLALALLACAAPLPRPRTEIIRRLLPSTVQVSSERRGVKLRVASGVVLRAVGPDRSLVLTTRHVIRGLDDVELYVRTGGSAAAGRRATVVATSPEADLALLELGGLALPPVTLGDGGGLGDEVWVVSYPWGRRVMLAGAVISQVESPGEGDDPERATMMIDASVSYGASGGGVFDASTGALVGIVKGSRTTRMSVAGDPKLGVEFPVAGETRVIPVRAIRRFLERAALPAP